MSEINSIVKKGDRFKYPQTDQIFELKSKSNFIYRFKCGHWCTDSVMLDLILLRKNTQVYRLISNQLKLF
jgi:hypothetical protein